MKLTSWMEKKSSSKNRKTSCCLEPILECTVCWSLSPGFGLDRHTTTTLLYLLCLPIMLWLRSRVSSLVLEVRVWARCCAARSASSFPDMLSEISVVFSSSILDRVWAPHSPSLFSPRSTSEKETHRLQRGLSYRVRVEQKVELLVVVCEYLSYPLIWYRLSLMYSSYCNVVCLPHYRLFNWFVFVETNLSSHQSYNV